MKRRIVGSGGKLAVPLPSSVVSALHLKRGDEVDVSMHPVTNAVIVRVRMKLFEDGKVTKRFDRMAKRVLKRYADAFGEMAR